MQSISSLLRAKTSLERSYRKTYGNVNMVRRKQKRQMKKINIYNKQYTGQTNQNSWLIPKRIKAMGHHLETINNNHIGTNPVDPAIQKQLLKVMPKLSEFQYYSFRNRQQQIIEFQQFKNSCDINAFIQQLPAKIRNQIQTDVQIPTPEIVEPLLKYTQQLQVYLPLDQRYRYNLMLRLKFPPKPSMGSTN